MMYSLVNLYQVHKGTDTPPGVPYHRKERMFQAFDIRILCHILISKPHEDNKKGMSLMKTDAKTIRKTLANLIYNLFKRPHNIIKLL